MRIRDWLEVVEPFVDVIIYADNEPSEDEPVFKGSAYDIPWTIVDWKIAEEDSDGVKPISIDTYTNEYGNKVARICIYAISQQQKGVIANVKYYFKYCKR